MAETHTMPDHGWTCFHCGETFRNIGPARDHFGAAPNCEPGCVIKAKGDWALLHELRRTELDRDLFEVRWNACQLGADPKEAVERFKATRETYFFPQRMADAVAIAEIARLSSAYAEAVDVLKPFAAGIEAFQFQARTQMPDDRTVLEIDGDGPYAEITYGDLRRARSLLSRTRAI